MRLKPTSLFRPANHRIGRAKVYQGPRLSLRRASRRNNPVPLMGLPRTFQVFAGTRRTRHCEPFAKRRAWQALQLNSKSQFLNSKQIQISRFENLNVVSIGIWGFEIAWDLRFSFRGHRGCSEGEAGMRAESPGISRSRPLFTCAPGEREEEWSRSIFGITRKYRFPRKTVIGKKSQLVKKS